MAGQPDLRTVSEEHVDAFNAHDTERLLRGLDEEITWHTGSDVVSGREALRTVFDEWLWDRAPRLDVRDLAVDGDRAAMECVEHIVLDGRVPDRGVLHRSQRTTHFRAGVPRGKC
jgi:ketosteroid isomerase-like protein